MSDEVTVLYVEETLRMVNVSLFENRYFFDTNTFRHFLEIGAKEMRVSKDIFSDSFF